jgi:hypothetical protein
VKPTRIVTDPLVPRGKWVIMPDPEHPDVDFMQDTITEAVAILIKCNPDEEERARDALAVAQEWDGEECGH